MRKYLAGIGSATFMQMMLMGPIRRHMDAKHPPPPYETSTLSV